jgi:hypothetical protein
MIDQNLAGYLHNRIMHVKYTYRGVCLVIVCILLDIVRTPHALCPLLYYVYIPSILVLR